MELRTDSTSHLATTRRDDSTSHLATTRRDGSTSHLATTRRDDSTSHLATTRPEDRVRLTPVSVLHTATLVIPQPYVALSCALVCALPGPAEAGGLARA